MNLRFLIKPLILLTFFTVYVLYVNLFGVTAFLSISMFLIPILMIFLFVYGIVVALSLRSAPKIHHKIMKIFIGIIISIFPLLIYAVSISALNDIGIKWKFARYEKQLTQMCEDILKSQPEREYLPLFKYKQFDIWSPGAKPIRQSACHKNGIVMLDFIGSPDNEAGVAYNPAHKELGDNFDHMFGPWYSFQIWRDESRTQNMRRTSGFDCP